jgi:hypothetical protein
MWDDIDSASSKTFDLADFSAATFKFSANSVKLSEATALYSKEGDETMESLMNEEVAKPQKEPEKKPSDEPKLGNERGRNLLLQVSFSSAPLLTHAIGQTLSVKAPAVPETKPVVPFSPFKATVQASTDDTLLDELIEEDGVTVPTSDVLADDKNDDSLTFDAADDLDLDSIIGGLTAAPLMTSAPGRGLPLAAVAPNPYLQQQSVVPSQQHLLPQHAQLSQPHLTAPHYSLGSQQQMMPPRPQMVSPSRPAPQPQIVSMMPPPPSAAPMPDKWIYRDPHGTTQGPFEMNAMRRWLESGYFKENLPIKMTRWSAFHPLGVVYPNPESAFLGLIHEPVMQTSHLLPPHMMPPQPMVSAPLPSPQPMHAPQPVPQLPTAMEQQRVEVQKVTEQRQEALSSKQFEDSQAAEPSEGKGKRAIQKPATPALIVTAPEAEAAPVSKTAKKAKETQPKDSQSNETAKGKTSTKAASEQQQQQQVASADSAAPKQKDASSANPSTSSGSSGAKKTKSAKKSSKEEDSSPNRKVRHSPPSLSLCPLPVLISL